MSPGQSRSAAGQRDALELDGIHTYRGAAHVLQGVSLRVGPGEAVCLVGRNGAGKTTTIESAMGILGVRTGRVTLQGRDITRLRSGHSPSGPRP